MTESKRDILDGLRERCSAVLKEETAAGAACGWRPCTGCYESEDGYPSGAYLHSDVFGCSVGAGCSECGGIGVTWEYYSKASLDKMVGELSEGPAEAVGRLISEAIRLAPKAGLFLKIRVEPAAIVKAEGRS